MGGDIAVMVFGGLGEAPVKVMGEALMNVNSLASLIDNVPAPWQSCLLWRS